jgi:cytochrome oxidase assembly protein ShyY1
MITPFYTHLNKKDEACAILVNRGWVPWDLKDVRLDRQVNETVVKGVLYRGDP